jgi:hypothetical protein
MPSTHESRRSSRKRSRRNPWIARSIWIAVGVIVLAIAGVAVIASQLVPRALEVKSELESAQALVGTMKDQALDFDIEGATATYETVSAHSAKAAELSDDGLWRSLEWVPFAGPNLRAVRELAAATDGIMSDVAAPLIAIAGQIDPSSFAPKDGGIDIAPLQAAIPAVTEANAGLLKSIETVNAIDTTGTLDQLVDGKTKIADLLDQIRPVTEQLSAVLPFLPPALGSEAPRTYVVMFQNNAESRSLGGAALSFAVVKVDQGRIALSSTESATFSGFPRSIEDTVALPDGVQQVYPNGISRFIADVTNRPSFSFAAQTVKGMWEEKFGYAIDGVLSIDPIALSYILRATDPITLSTGDVLTSDTLVPLLLNQLYLRYDSGSTSGPSLKRDNERVDAVFGEAVDATFSTLTTGPLDAKLLIPALMQGWDERRILYWSSNADEQAKLASYGSHGEIPVSDDSHDRFGLYFQDAAGAKLNYYLEQQITTSQAVCRTDGRASYRVSANLVNTLDAATAKSAPFAITGNWKNEKIAAAGIQRLVVRLYAPPGATVDSITVNGVATAFSPLHDGENPVAMVTVDVPVASSLNITYDITPAGAGEKALELESTPMVRAATITETPLDCATVAAQ